MKAIIMAGGEGARLRPMTLKMPKPLAPVLGESVMSHILRLLKKHGINDCAATLMFMPEKITEKYGKSFEDVSLSYYREEKPLGTAGSVKNAEKFLLDDSRESHDNCFIVISGDALCDTNLSAAVEFHKASGSDATLIITKSKSPLEFGAVLTEKNSVVSFIEKPSWGQVFTDKINTGIYILNNDLLKLIPPGKSYDFGKEFFPYLLDNKYKLRGYEDNNFWCDIGDVDAFYYCNKKALAGEIEIVKDSPNYKNIRNGFFMDDRADVWNCDVKADSMILKNVRIKSGGRIGGALIFEGARIGANCEIERTVICRNVSVGDNVKIGDGCVVGENCVIGDGAVITGGVKIWADIKIDGGTKVDSNIIFSSLNKNIFDDDGLRGYIDDNLTPEYCVKIGLACGSATSEKDKPGRIGVMYNEFAGGNYNSNPETGNGGREKIIFNSLLCGISASGAKSYNFGGGFESLAAFTAGHFRLDALLYVDRVTDNNGKTYNKIKIFDKNTLYPSRPFERKFEAALNRDDGKRIPPDDIYESEVFEGVRFVYFSEVLRKNNRKITGFKVGIESGVNNINGTAPHILKKALVELGAQVMDIKSDGKNFSWKESFPVIKISEEGLDLSVYDSKTPHIIHDFWHIIAALEKDSIKNGATEIALPFVSPHALERIAADNGADVYKYLFCSFDDNIESDKKAKAQIFSQMYLKDSLFAAVYLCGILHGTGVGINEFMNDVLIFSFRSREIDDGGADKSETLNRLRSVDFIPKDEAGKYCACNLCNDSRASKKIDLRSTEGVKLEYRDGLVHVMPKKYGGFKLFAEAFSNEAAEELLDITSERIKKMI